VGRQQPCNIRKGKRGKTMRHYMADTVCPHCLKEITIEVTQQGNIITWTISQVTQTVVLKKAEEA
jgi:uncharacterized OB-fold protein